MQTQQRTPLCNRETTNVFSAYSWNSTKRLSYHVNLWEGSSMQSELRNQSWVTFCASASSFLSPSFTIIDLCIPVVPQGRVLASSPSVNRLQLSISKLTPSDAGNYTCRSSNKLSSVTRDAQLTVQCMSHHV